MAAAIDREEEADPLNQPFSDLNFSTFENVVLNMSVESSLRKHDWRALAGVMNFSAKQVQLMQQDTRERYALKGRLLVEVCEELGRGSLRKFIYALKEANMGECLREIKKDPDLEEAEVDFDAVLKDYEELKAKKLFRQEFPRVQTDKFREAMYPKPIRIENAPSIQDHCVEESVAKENSSSSSNESAQPPVRKLDNHVLDERSVYISYCPVAGFKHRKFNKQLCKMAEFLQNQGYLLHFEPNSQAQIRLCGGVVEWKEACIKKSKNIIVVCTAEYYAEDGKAAELDQSRKSASKIAVDSRLLRQLAYSPENYRIIPVMLDVCKPVGCVMPMWLQPLVSHSWPSGQNDLDLCLQDLPRYVIKKPDLTQRKVITPIVIDYPQSRRHKFK